MEHLIYTQTAGPFNYNQHLVWRLTEKQQKVGHVCKLIYVLVK